MKTLQIFQINILYPMIKHRQYPFFANKQLFMASESKTSPMGGRIVRAMKKCLNRLISTEMTLQEKIQKKASTHVYYITKVAENFVESKAKNFSIAVATVKFFNEAIGKISKTWCDNNILELMLRKYALKAGKQALKPLNIAIATTILSAGLSFNQAQAQTPDTTYATGWFEVMKTTDNNLISEYLNMTMIPLNVQMTNPDTIYDNMSGTGL